MKKELIAFILKHTDFYSKTYLEQESLSVLKQIKKSIDEKHILENI